MGDYTKLLNPTPLVEYDHFSSEKSKAGSDAQRVIARLKFHYWEGERSYPNDIRKNWYVLNSKCFLLTDETGMRKCVQVDDELHKELEAHYRQCLDELGWCCIL